MMTRYKKTEYAVHALITLSLIALLIAASFFDEKISASLYSVNFISKMGAVLGKIPAYFIFAFAGSVLFKSAINKEKKYRSRTPLIVLYILVSLLGSAMLGISMVDDVISSKALKLVIGAVLALLCFATVTSLVMTITTDKINLLKKWAFASLITVAVIIVVVAVVKLVWGRVRYEDIVTGQGPFTPWYKPNGYTGSKSMPSGHVALAACLFLTVPMFRALPNMKSVSVGMIFISAAFTLAVAFSRIMGGHHFLSDVTVALIVSYVTISLSSLIAYGRSGDKFLMSDGNVLNRL